MRDQSYDTVNLRYNADFEVYISRDLYWIPFNTLGKTRYTNGEMRNFISMDPLQKQKEISNLYEAIQLFQLSEFKDIRDVWMINDNNTSWEHHRPGYDAVFSNYGCCSSIASWFAYILKYCYINKGHLMICRPDGSAHLLNFIYNDGFYYIYDPSTMVMERAINVACESGSKPDYIGSKFATGIFMKTESLDNFVKYHSRIQLTRGFEHLYLILEDMDYIPPLHIVTLDGKASFYFPANTKIIQLNETKTIAFGFMSAPQSIPDWRNYKLE